VSDQFPPPAPQGDQPAPQVPSGAWVANPEPGPMPGSNRGSAFPAPEPDRSTSSRLRVLARFAVPAVAIGIAVFGYLGQADRDDAGAIVGSGSLTVVDLRVGDCFDDEAAEGEEVLEISEVAARPCGEPHDNEVFHTFDLTGDTVPSDDEVYAQVGEECIPAFDTFVGAVYEDSELDLFPIWPTAAAWDQGDRAVTCALYDADGSKLVGSAQGTGR
jgi:hypothetical protein